VPFLSEEIWAFLPGAEGSLVRAPFPHPDDIPRDIQIERDIQYILDAITGIRNIRGEMNVPPSARLEVRIICPSSTVRATLEAHEEYIRMLSGLASLEILEQGERPPHAAVSVTQGMEIYVLLAGILNFEEEMKRLQKNITRLNKELERITNKLQNVNFIQRAPRDVIEKEQEREGVLLREKQKLENNLGQILEIRSTGQT
jgi:valyl-tRNA synthetase